MGFSIDPGQQTVCPVCKGEFENPDIREDPKDLHSLNYYCPLCGYHYAHWPKTLRIEP